MRYTFESNLDEKIYQQFVSKYSGVSFMQDVAWTKVKNNWEHLLCGVYEKDILVAACSILIRSLPMNLKMFYIPRGYLCDFNNLELLSFFTTNIKSLAKENKAYVVKIDPNFCVSEKTWKEISTNEVEESPKVFSLEYEQKHQNLIKLGYHHRGFTTSLAATLQPRYQMACPLIDKNLKRLSIDDVTAHYKSKVRYYLGDFHAKRGVTFEVTNDLNRLDDFISILNFTQERQNIILRNKDYFKKILESYPNQVKLLFGYIDMNKYIEYLKESKGKGLSEAIDLKEERGDILLMSASLVILPSNSDGIRVSEYLYAGNNLLYPNLRISTGMVYEILKLSIDYNCDYCNLGGIDGEFKDHLTEFKSKFNPIVFEYAGEYDLPIKKNTYHFIEKFEPVLKKLYQKLFRK